MASPDGHTRPFDARRGGHRVLRRRRDGGAAAAVATRSPTGDTDLRGAARRRGQQRRQRARELHRAEPRRPGRGDRGGARRRRHRRRARISYVEAHGTATPLGDPIEIEGLTPRVRAAHPATAGFCAIGSLKSNVGHLVIAAGAASLIKTALALHRQARCRRRSASTAPNPADRLRAHAVPRADARSTAWPATARGPRRAGVSSFGFGGTNAHVVLEEAPPARFAPRRRAAPVQLLPSRRAARRRWPRQARDLGALSSTASPRRRSPTSRTRCDVGRRALRAPPLRRRRRPSTEAAERCSRPDSAIGAGAREVGAELPDVGFLCPGPGLAVPGMGRGLHAAEPAFRAAYDECCRDRRRAHRRRSARACSSPTTRRRWSPTSVTQPAIFALEYALARLWMSWGVEPTALIGHSVGELACAALAGVMPLADALGLVRRARRAACRRCPPAACCRCALPVGELHAAAARWRRDRRRERARAVRGVRARPSASRGSRPTLAAEADHRRAGLVDLARVPLGDDGSGHRAAGGADCAGPRCRAAAIPILSTVTARLAQRRGGDQHALLGGRTCACRCASRRPSPACSPIRGAC